MAKEQELKTEELEWVFLSDLSSATDAELTSLDKPSSELEIYTIVENQDGVV